jgi:hypothetical protein
MDMIGRTFRNDILQANVTMFKTIGVEPTALENGNVPLDLDVTPFDNSNTFKEGVSRTYKGYDGYAPMMVYISAEGYLSNTELREGKQHSQKRPPAFLRKTFDIAHQLTDKPLLVRVLFEHLEILVRIAVDKALPIFQRDVVQFAIRNGHTNDRLVAIGAIPLPRTTQTIAMGTAQLIGHSHPPLIHST